ncbi:hypothetical protein LENED_004291 [Lentinula edodes]|uniref:DUF6532 domain-containing protein n=1 Tax=Lentinula edodes TaxID=5353 RepID=A0A1Q3E651_LENED|nr:hypothetical protein LENED_004291 [Lentinula edodes]
MTQPTEKRDKSRISADDQNLNVGHTWSAAQKEDQEEDNNMDTGGDDEDTEAMDERQDDLDAGRQLENEAPRFTITNTVNAGIRTTLKSKSDSPSLSFDDNGTLTENLEFEFSPLARSTPLPVVVISDVANSVTLAEVQEKPVEKEPQWMPRTNIVLNRYTSTTRTFTLGKNSQNDDVKGVISLAIKRGCLLLFMEPELKEECEEEEYQCNVDACCLTVSGLKKLTLDALVWAAEQRGFEGENDMADRLECGDTAKYVNPLIKYVSGRISLERGSLKNYSATILAALDIDNSPAGIMKAHELVRESNYIYPIGRNGQYDYSRPFEHEVVTRYLNDALFSNSKFSKAYIAPHKAELFKSSIPKRPLELELPKRMLAMASCVIHAVLVDVGKSKKDDFLPSGLETQWQTFLDILTGLESSSKLNFHMFVHKLYLRALHSVGLTTHGLSTTEVLRRIDFEAFARANPIPVSGNPETVEGTSSGDRHDIEADAGDCADDNADDEGVDDEGDDFE